MNKFYHFYQNNSQGVLNYIFRDFFIKCFGYPLFHKPNRQDLHALQSHCPSIGIWFKHFQNSSITTVCLAQDLKEEYNVPLSDINLSNPFIFADNSDNTYYMYGSGGNGMVMASTSKDLKNWTARFVVYKFPAEHWAGEKAPCLAAVISLCLIFVTFYSYYFYTEIYYFFKGAYD